MTASPKDLAQGRLAIIMADDCLHLLAVRSSEAADDPINAAATMLAAMQFLVARALRDLDVPLAVFTERVEATIRVLAQRQKASAS